MAGFANVQGRADLTDVLVPDQVINEIIAEPPKQGVIRSRARTIRLSAKKAKQPVLASLLALPRYKDQVTDDKPTTFTVGTTNTMGTNGAVTSYLSTYQPAGRQVPTEGRMDEGLARGRLLAPRVRVAERAIDAHADAGAIDRRVPAHQLERIDAAPLCERDERARRCACDLRA